MVTWISYSLSSKKRVMAMSDLVQEESYGDIGFGVGILVMFSFV